MANRLMKQFQGTLEAGVVKLFGSVTTSTSGTISSTSCKGFSVAKTAAKTGRYTVTLSDYYNGLLACDVRLVGAADTAYTTAKGSIPFLRNVSVSSSGKSFDIQWARSDTTADAEVLDAAVFYIEITLKNSSAY